MQITNNIILITGGTRGIGRALAKAFLELKNQVIVTGRNEVALEKAETNGLIPFKCDLTSRTDIESLVLFIENKYPDLNILINNAGIQYNYHFLEESSPYKMVQQEIETNLTGQIMLTSMLLPILTTKGASAIVNITSTLALNPKEDGVIYSASKAAFRSYTIGLRYQLESTPTKVIELMPPLVDTHMTNGRGKQKISPEAFAKIFIRDFAKGKEYITSSQIKIYRVINYLFPGLAAKMIRA